MSDKLTKSQFDVLCALQRAGAPRTQRELHHETSLSLGTINATVRELTAAGLLDSGLPTKEGIEALAPYKVRNAIIMAAGLSSRFAPISYERPKGTLRVRGEILIERQIRQLRETGIEDITVVVGYKQENFFYLKKKFGVEIVVNQDYLTRNNNGSLYLVREKLGNSFICSSDNYFTENPFEPYVYQAYYAAEYVEGPTKEWCLHTNRSGRITGATIGGADSWTMLGHVYFDRPFAQTFRTILEAEYHLPHTAPKLWESLFIEHVHEFSMVIRKYPAGLINEFDSVDELRAFDPLFMENIDSKIFENITSALGCKSEDIHDFYPLKQGLTNLSCHFSVGEEEYVYRHPGIGTESIIDRHAEFQALALAKELGLDSTFLTGEEKEGWKISRFIPNSRCLDATNDEELATAMTMARTLHLSGKQLSHHFDYFDDGLTYEKLLTRFGPIEIEGYEGLKEKVLRVKTFADSDHFPTGPCHIDLFPLNFLVGESGSIDLIDWEYAGMSDIAADIATFLVCTQDMTPERADDALTFYFGRTPTKEERRHTWAYVVLAGWCWYIWSLLKEAEGDDVGEWLYIYYRSAVDYVDAVLKAYETDSEMEFTS